MRTITEILRFLKHSASSFGVHKQLWAIGIAAAMLRWYYAFFTRFNVRGYDAESHLEYVRWMLLHWSIPKAAEGYEYYHPPLYYALAALWSLLTGGWNGEMVDPRPLQVLAWLISCATIWVTVLIAKELFRTPETRHLQAPFSALVVFLPSILLMASRANNDTLSALLQFSAILFLLRWWNNASDRHAWYYCLLFLGFGLLTKLNTIVLLPIPFLCLFLHHKNSRRYRSAACGLTIVMFFLFLVPTMRWMGNGEIPGKIIPNTDALGGLELPPTTIGHITAFHPLKILKIPFNDNFDDASNRMYLWDYLMRSALSGEWYHGPLLVFFAQIQLFLALLLLLPVLWGIRKRFSIALRMDAPLALIIPLLLIAIVRHRIAYPFSCSVDFRFITFLALPMAYYLLRGIEAFPPVLRFRAMTLVWAFVGSMILFVLGLVTIAG